MGPKKKTRSVSGDIYANVPCDLPDSDLPTHGDVASYFYFVRLTEKDYPTLVNLVRDRIIGVWQACNPRLPLLEKKKVYDKLKHFLDKVRSYDKKQMKLAAKKLLILQKEKLFDIAACNCDLPEVKCDDPVAKCNAANCVKKHFMCQCPQQFKIPVEDREYMKDQRQKVGTRGNFQMRGRDILAAAQDRIQQQRASQKIARDQARHQRVQHLSEVVANPDFEVSNSVGTSYLSTGT
jgi:hypothetical protein